MRISIRKREQMKFNWCMENGNMVKYDLRRDPPQVGGVLRSVSSR